jgi:hypothetical protein
MSFLSEEFFSLNHAASIDIADFAAELAFDFALEFLNLLHVMLIQIDDVGLLD